MKELAELLEQRFDHLCVCPRLAIIPDRFLVRNTIAEREPEEFHKRKSVENLVLHLSVAQAVKRLQDQDFEHHHRVVRPTPALVFRRLRSDRFERRPELFPIDQFVKHHQRITRLAQLLQPHIKIKNPFANITKSLKPHVFP